MTKRTNKLIKLKISRWIDYFNIPLHRNGLALMISSMSTSGLGLAYWAVAARNYSTEVVGINSAVLSGMMLLGNISQFGLVNFLNRFLPKAGRATIRYIGFSYLFSVFIGLITSILFVLGIDLWSPTLGFLRSNTWVFAWFVLATALWCIFALQDGVLVGLRYATWVPVENIIFALVKLGLLFLFTGVFSQFGIFASWTFPLIFLIIGTNTLVFRQIIPRHMHETEMQAEHFNLSQVTRFIVGDYFGRLVWLATVNLMPIIVLELAGATANAYFYLPWMITLSLYMISRSMGMSLTVEAAKDQSYLEEFSYRSIIQNAIITVPVVLVILVASPFILQLFGSGYAAEGSSLLRLLALSALPHIVTSLYVSIARVQRQIMNIFITLSALCGLVLLFTFIFLEQLGLVGVGLAWLISQLIIATLITLTKLRSILILEPSRRLIKWISHTIQRIRFASTKRQIYTAVRKVKQDIVHSLSEQHNFPPVESLVVHQVFNTMSDMAVAALSQNGSSPELILYLSQSKLAEERMKSQLRVLASLNSDEHLSEWRQLLPKFKKQGKVGRSQYWIFEYIPGIQADEVMKDPSMQDNVLRIAGEAIMMLHRETATPVIVDERIINTWVHDPIRIIKNSKLPYYSRRTNETLDRLNEELNRTLRNRKLTLSWTQGDYWPQNILVTPDGRRVTGIVDWDQAEPWDLPYLDLVNLFLSTRRLNETREMGELIVEVISQNAWRPIEQQIWEDESHALGEFVPGFRETMLLFWLRHISANLTKSKRYSYNPIWALKNYVTVLEAFNYWEDLRSFSKEIG